MTQRLPTFQEVRKRHGITLNMLIEDAQMYPSAVLLLDTWNIGEAGMIDALLASLSRLSGITYRRDRRGARGLHLFGGPSLRAGRRSGGRGEPGTV